MWRVQSRQNNQPYACEIAIPRGAKNIIIGTKGMNIKLLKSRYPEILYISIKDERSQCLVVAETEEALHSVQKDIYVSLKYFSNKVAEKDIHFMKQSDLTRELSIREKFNKTQREFWMRRFRKIRGVIHIAFNVDGSLIRYIYKDTESKVGEIDPIEYLIKNIEVNGRFIDQEEIWKRARSGCPQLQFHMSNSFTGSILLDAEFMKSFGLRKLEELNDIYGINYIDIEGKHDDTIVAVLVSARFPNVVDYVITELRNDFNYFTSKNKIIHRYSKDEELTTSSASLPIPCGTEWMLLRKLPDTDLSFLEYIFNDPSVTVLELDMTQQILNVSCKLAESLEFCLFNVRKQLCFHKKRPWRTLYKFNDVIFFKFNISVEDISTAIVGDVKDDENIIVEVIDHINKDIDPVKVLHKIVYRTDKGINANNRTENLDVYKMKKLLTEFIQFDDFADLDNIRVRSSVGERFFGISEYTKQFNVFTNERNQENSLWFLGKNLQYFRMCLDLKLLHNDLISFLSRMGYTQSNTRRYSSMKFNDLSSNRMYYGEREENESDSIKFLSCRKDPNLDTIKIRSLHDTHLGLEEIGTDSENQRLVQSISVTSMPFLDDVGCPEAKLFVSEAIRYNKIGIEDFMSINNQYSMNLVCFIEEYDLTCGQIVVQIENITKKSIQRYGKFATVSRFSIFCPSLDADMNNLQKNVNNKILKSAVLANFQALILEGERLTDQINIFIKTYKHKHD